MHNQEPSVTQETGASEMETTSVKPKGEKLSDTQKESILNFVEYLIDNLTIKRVFLIALFAILGMVLYSLYENRTAIMTSILAKPNVAQAETIGSWELSENSKTSLKGLMLGTPIKFVSVTEVDLKKNSRIVRYLHLDDNLLNTQEKDFLRVHMSRPQSVFDYDTNNTAQMVGVLANEFRCDNYVDTIHFKTAPQLSNRLTTICRLAIPPFVGQFVGFISVGLDRKVSKAELDSLRLEVSRVAVEIYLQDVTKQKPPGL